MDNLRRDLERDVEKIKDPNKQQAAKLLLEYVILTCVDEAKFDGMDTSALMLRVMGLWADFVQHQDPRLKSHLACGLAIMASGLLRDDADTKARYDEAMLHMEKIDGEQVQSKRLRVRKRNRKTSKRTGGSSIESAFVRSFKGAR